jgi:hypothetical protein
VASSGARRGGVVTGARGIAAAGAIALVVTGSHTAYRSWPVRHGTEVCLPAALVRQSAALALVAVRLPLARIELDVPHTRPAVGEPFEPLRRIGDWWAAGGSAGTNARRLRGRPLYLQLTPGRPLWTGGPDEMRASTVSDGLVGGAINLAGLVSSVREDGYLWLDFSFGPIAVPPAVAAAARPFTDPGPRPTAAGPILPATDPGVAAVLRVLPSGRAALVGVIVNGTRY